MEPNTVQHDAITRWARFGVVLALAGAPAAAQGSKGVPGELVWDARAAEHLMNRAGFGARPAEIAQAVEMGAEAFVESLFAVPKDQGRFEAQRFDHVAAKRELERDPGTDDPASRRMEFAAMVDVRDADQEQRDDYLDFWMEQMLAAEDPLRERMTLFWRGYFTSSYRDVKNSYELIAQSDFLRTNTFGHFSELVQGIARDPAMLEYLDNDSNRKGQPNENFARELMELFTLGEGNYTEEDVKEAARAFTGWTDEDGVFTFAWKRHDFGEKTVLGKTGRLDGDDVLDVLLEQETCARYVAGRLLRYFEGSEPPSERIAEYGAFLSENEYDLELFLRRLFLDPRFYRDEIVGARVASPIDFLIGCARRLDVEPPGRFLTGAAALLGERPFDPPNVKGWEGGEAWITTSSLIERSNFVAALLGLVAPRDVMGRDARGVDPRPEGDADDARERGGRGARGILARWGLTLDFVGRVEAAGAVHDAEIVDYFSSELLAVPPSAEIRADALAFLAAEREELGEPEGKWLGARKAEEVLRRLVHFVLSMPDAHLN